MLAWRRSALRFSVSLLLLSGMAGATETVPGARLLPSIEPTADPGTPISPSPVDSLLFDASIEPAAWPQVCVCPAPTPPPKFPSVAVTGFFQADAIWFAQDDANIGAVGDAQDVADFRRARLAAKGKVAENVDYMMEYDFAFPGRPSFMDVYVDLADVSRFGHLRIG
ncbi:hypothetical protein Pla111_17860 [Botrimarina hoheduenensis]|uniref:Uncharacterized protein n=1 Tax=Botrimarina hoheduenensis TaxID=2528000 RepID=A0A5C5W910_9BACT|nr:hypothetical protein Pla111_17860 [Botrimarina hoheduenensis]